MNWNDTSSRMNSSKRFEDEPEESPKTSVVALSGRAVAAISEDFLKGIGYLASKFQMSFSKKLMWWIKEHKRKPVEIYSAVGITKGHFAKIRNNIHYHPTKETVLAFVVALHLSMEEAADLLKRAGYALSDSCLSDMIVAYFLEAKRYNIDEVNEALYRHDCKPLTNWRDCK
ncbi:hypothetical protein [Selenomonas sp. AB3002]|uniref:hypothetical protein n=1 Tax=Selenomonas sp. AB3002 TaxID=1392502 RepID=UPI000691D53A